LSRYGLETELQDRLGRLADAKTWQIEEIEMGIAEADAGDFASEAHVKAVFSKWRRRAQAWPLA